MVITNSNVCSELNGDKITEKNDSSKVNRVMWVITLMIRNG